MPDRRSSGRFTHQRARVDPRLWSRIRKQLLARSFVLATWSPCRGPRRSAASELAVVPSATPGSPSSNAWPVRPRHASPRHIVCPTSLRALHGVPRIVSVRASSKHATGPGQVAQPSRSKLALNRRSLSPAAARGRTPDTNRHRTHSTAEKRRGCRQCLIIYDIRTREIHLSSRSTTPKSGRHGHSISVAWPNMSNASGNGLSGSTKPIS